MCSVVVWSFVVFLVDVKTTWWGFVVFVVVVVVGE